MRRPERNVYLSLGAALSTISIPWLEANREFSIPIGYPMVMALGLVAVVANLSSIRRFWSIAKAIRVREKNLAEAYTGVPDSLIEEQEGSQISHRPTVIRF